MQVVLDTSFIVHCIRKNIDFVKILEGKGFKVVMPREVVQELQHLEHDVKTSVDDKNRLNKVLGLFSDHKRFKRISAGNTRIADWLKKKDSEGYLVASLDKSIKHDLKNRVVVHEDGSLDIEQA